MGKPLLRHTWGLAALSPFTAKPPVRDDYECRGPLGPVTVDGDLIVPDDATCTLTGTRVRGNVVVKSRATLEAQGVKVRGGVQSEGSKGVHLKEATVSKDVQVTKGEPKGAITIRSSQLKGNLQLEDNRGPIAVDRSRVTGSIQLSKNKGGITLTRNRVGNTLEAQDNEPPPSGEANKAREKKGQCKKMPAAAARPAARPGPPPQHKAPRGEWSRTRRDRPRRGPLGSSW